MHACMNWMWPVACVSDDATDPWGPFVTPPSSRRRTNVARLSSVAHALNRLRAQPGLCRSHSFSRGLRISNQMWRFIEKKDERRWRHGWNAKQRVGKWKIRTESDSDGGDHRRVTCKNFSVRSVGKACMRAYNFARLTGPSRTTRRRAATRAHRRPLRQARYLPAKIWIVSLLASHTWKINLYRIWLESYFWHLRIKWDYKVWQWISVLITVTQIVTICIK